MPLNYPATGGGFPTPQPPLVERPTSGRRPTAPLAPSPQQPAPSFPASNAPLRGGSASPLPQVPAAPQKPGLRQGAGFLNWRSGNNAQRQEFLRKQKRMQSAGGIGAVRAGQQAAAMRQPPPQPPMPQPPMFPPNQIPRDFPPYGGYDY